MNCLQHHVRKKGGEAQFPVTPVNTHFPAPPPPYSQQLGKEEGHPGTRGLEGRELEEAAFSRGFFRDVPGFTARSAGPERLAQHLCCVNMIWQS